MKYLLIILFIMLNIPKVISQCNYERDTNLCRHTLFFELKGSSIQSSINYEYIAVSKQWLKVAFAFGLAQFPSKAGNATFTPQSNFLFGKRKIKFECGYSLVFLNSKEKIYQIKFVTTPISVFRLGLRYQSEDGGMLYRIGYTPFLLDFQSQLYSHFGISIGYTFHKSH